MGLSLPTQQNTRSFLRILRGAPEQGENQKSLLLPWGANISFLYILVAIRDSLPPSKLDASFCPYRKNTLPLFASQTWKQREGTRPKPRIQVPSSSSLGYAGDLAPFSFQNRQ